MGNFRRQFMNEFHPRNMKGRPGSRRCGEQSQNFWRLRANGQGKLSPLFKYENFQGWLKVSFLLGPPVEGEGWDLESFYFTRMVLSPPMDLAILSHL